MKKNLYRLIALTMSGCILLCNTETLASEVDTGKDLVSITEAVENYIPPIVTPDILSNSTSITETLDYIVDEPEYLEKLTYNAAKYPQFIGIAIPKIENTESSLNIRAEANEESERLGKLSAGGAGQIIEQGEEWTKIESGSVIGYVKNEFMVTGDEAGEFAQGRLPQAATVTTETLFVREEQSVESTCLSMVPEGDTYAVVEEYEDWAQVKVDDELTGFVSKDYVNVYFVLDCAISKEEEEAIIRREQEEKEEAERKKRNAGRQDICDYAVQFVGNPYVWGGASLTNGADCSGFTMRVFAKFGYSLPHSAAAQANCGSPVALSDIKPGDLLFYKGSGGGITHVTMYIGNGQVVHASSKKTGIKISSVGYRQACSARRIAN